MHVDGLLKEQAEMEEAHRETARTVGEQRVLDAKLDLAPFLVVDLLHDIGRGAGRRYIGRVGVGAGARLEQIVGERLRFVILQAFGGKGFAESAERERRSGDAFQDRAAIWMVGHVDPRRCESVHRSTQQLFTNHNEFHDVSLARYCLRNVKYADERPAARALAS